MGTFTNFSLVEAAAARPEYNESVFTAFSKAFAQDVASVLRINQNQIEILKVSIGSTIVEFRVISDGLEQLENRLRGDIEWTTLSKLPIQKKYNIAINADSKVVQVEVPVTQESAEWLFTIVLVGIVVLVAIFVAPLLLLRRRETPKVYVDNNSNEGEGTQIAETEGERTAHNATAVNGLRAGAPPLPPLLQTASEGEGKPIVRGVLVQDTAFPPPIEPTRRDGAKTK